MVIWLLIIQCFCDNSYVESTDKTELVISCSGNCGLITKTDVQKTKLYSNYIKITVNSGPTGIDSEGFIDCKRMEIITLSNTISSIGQFAFSGCSSLKYINLPDGLTYINTQAFYYCSSLEWISFPSTLNKIDPFNIVYGCSQLESFKITQNPIFNVLDNGKFLLEGTKIISFAPKHSSATIPASVTQLNSACFNGCSNLKQVDFEQGSLTVIGSTAFRQTSIKEISFPEGVTTLSSRIFALGQIQTVVLPSTLTSVSSTVFQETSTLESVTVRGNPPGLYLDSSGVIYNAEKNAIIFLPKSIEEFHIMKTLKEISPSLITSSTKLVNLTIDENHSKYNVYGNSLYSSNFDTFYALSGGLTEHHIHPNCVTILTNSFCYTNIRNLSLKGSNLKYINSYSFIYTYKLETIIFNSKLEEIRDGAFVRSGIKEIALPSSLLKINNEAFGSSSLEVCDASKCTKLTEITGLYNTKLHTILLPEGIQKINGIYSTPYLKEITIPSTVAEIGEEAFADSGLVSIIFAQNCPFLKKIGSEAFARTKFASFHLPPSVIEIGEKIFSGCSSLEALDIGTSSELTALPPYFIEGTKVSSIALGGKLSSISECALAGCLTLVNVDINQSNQHFTVHKNVVYNTAGTVLVVCPNGLEEVRVEGAVGEIRSSAFFGCARLADLSFDSSSQLKEIAKSTFFGCTALKSVSIPASVEGLLESSFAGCTALEEFIIPVDNVLKKIGVRALEGCLCLKKVTLGNATSLLEIGASSFEGCKAFVGLRIPSSVVSIGSRAFFGCTELKGVFYCSNDNKNIGDSSVFDSCPFVIVYVSENFVGEYFCGIKPFAVLDKNCNVPTSRFTLEFEYPVVGLLVSASSLLQSD